MSMKPFLLLPLLALSGLPFQALAEAKPASPDVKAAASAPAAKPAEEPSKASTSPAEPTAPATPVPAAAATPVPASEAAKPTASAPAKPAVSSAAPASPSAEADAPLLPEVAGSDALTAPVSPTADASGDSVVAEEVGESGQLAAGKTESPDLSKLDSETLATLAGGVDREAPDVFFDPVAKQTLVEASAGAWQVPVDALYYELAKRTLNDNKDTPARQSFALAIMKDTERAKFAKELAYDDKLADAVIAQIEAGKPKARMELQGLAEKGNRKARLYLGMDKPVARGDAGAMTPTAAVSTPTSPTAATSAPAPASPTATSPTAPKASSPTAVSAPAPAPSSPTAAPVAPKADIPAKK